MGERVRYPQRGIGYVVLGVAELKIAYARVMEGSKLAIYRGGDGRLWAHEVGEFRDGRFKTITPAPTPSPSPGSSKVRPTRPRRTRSGIHRTNAPSRKLDARPRTAASPPRCARWGPERRAMGEMIQRLAYRPKDAAAVLGVSRSTIYQMIADGQIAARKLGSATLSPYPELACVDCGGSRQTSMECTPGNAL